MNAPVPPQVATAVEFGVLQDAPLREAWAHEALSFTPWLANNLDRLGQEIGIQLEFEATEHRVGPFSADILARNPMDDTRVLIENQLEPGDHNHLGQIMTYLTGLDAKTVVWVAPSFRDEHLSALRWLNEHTFEAGFSFFAVRLRVVRIGNSPYAPLFEVVERPNGWDRRLQEAAREAHETSPIVEFRRGFWAHLAARHPEVGFSTGSSSSQWLPAPETGLIVSAFITQSRVGVFVRGGRGAGGDVVAPQLAVHERVLEERLGAPLGQLQFPFEKALVIDLTQKANWNAAVDWLVAESQRYAAVLSEVLSAGAG